MKYRCEATSLEGFVQQLAANYLTTWLLVLRHGPCAGGEGSASVDQKLIEKYGVNISRQQRARASKPAWPTFITCGSEGSGCYWPHMARHRFFMRKGKMFRCPAAADSGRRLFAVREARTIP